AVLSPGFAAFAVVVQGRNANYSFAADEHFVATLSLQGTVLDGFECSDVVFGPNVPWHCTANASGTRVSCGARRVGPCHVSDPDDMMICDALNAADAENRYHDTHGSYLAGWCGDLPGFVPSPGVTCSTNLSGLAGFVVTTSHPAGRWPDCVWVSDPAPENPNLV